jgi:ATP-dependent RNA helicase RhlE
LKESILVSSFDHLGLADSLLRAVRAEGYHTATPIQLQAIPTVLAGRDLMGCAQTGTGKTAAFALPTLHRLCTTGVSAGNESPTARNGAENGKHDSKRLHRNRRPIRSLILAPTRELAAQIGASFASYGKFTGMRCTVVYGGVGQGPQVRALQSGVDILVATPGRLLDLMEQGYIDLKSVQILILDEADQMLDMGFIVPLRRIVASVPKTRQTLMFSATMPPEIRKLAGEWLRDPTHVQVGPVATPIELVEQSVYFVEPRHKPHLLTHFLQNTAFTRTLVFARTKHGADKIVKQLVRSGIRALAIHGNKSQNVRQRTLDAFKSSRPPVLVATDVAARGLDVDSISHVVNYDLPDVPEMYVHRIGRTGRAGATGIATSFCARDERDQLRQIERLTRRAITVEQDQPEYPHVEVSARDHDSRSNGNRSRGPSKSRRPAPQRALAAAGAGSGRPVSRRRRTAGGRRNAL